MGLLPASEKPTKAERKMSRRVESALVGAATVGIKRGLPRAAAALAPFTGAQLAAVAAAGIAAYYGTSWVMNQLDSGVTDPKFLGAMAFRKAHVAFSEKLGRQPTRDENRVLMNEVVKSMTKRLAVRTALPFGLGEVLSAVTGGRI